MKGKALIIYSSITGNTAKVAGWFQETFEHYNMEVTSIRVKNKMDWDIYEGKTYFEDYDVVCLGSPIIAGAPTKAMIKLFSPGGGSDLEANVTANADAGKGFNDGGAGFPKEMQMPDGPGEPGAMPQLPGPHFQRDDYTKGYYMYAGGPFPQEVYQPLGIAFCTYGGGMLGSSECLATLETLELYLRNRNCIPVGKFACCGMEFGPAGLKDGEKPMTFGGDIPAPKVYVDADGTKHIGSYFFHTHMDQKPGPRDEMKAKALIADLVEDYFYSWDGKRKTPGSQYISIS
jgi:hypothetical protein